MGPGDVAYALKLVSIGSDPATQEALLLELRTMTAIHSPYICRFINAFSQSGSKIAMLMEFCPDGSAADVMARRGPVSEPGLRALARCLLRGLSHLHHHCHTLHRDIKPANVLMASDAPAPSGEGVAAIAKLADFGVSTQIESTLQQANTFVGTLVYMSPERIQGAAYGAASDVWAVGLSLLELAIGRFPYADPAGHKPKQFFQLLELVLQQPVPVPAAGSETDSTSPLCSAGIAFITACLEKDPAERPSADTLLAHPWFSTGDAMSDSAALRAWCRSD
jgi:mitogen-activated protein kinase kinase 1